MALKAVYGGTTDYDDLENFGLYADEILVLSGNNDIYTYEGNDIIHLQRAAGGTTQRVSAGDGDDIVYGGLSMDRVWDGSGNDRVMLGDGNDHAYVGGGNDVIDGGGGVDYIDFFWLPSGAPNQVGITFDLAKTTAQDLGAFGLDTITGFEWVGGSWGPDTLFGSAADNTFYGGDGSDQLYGRAGNDWLYGDAGDDVLDGGPGADALYGGGGFDTATYAASAAGVTINLAGDAGVAGDAAGDRIYEVEKLIGSNFNDTLGGGFVDSTIEGLAGNDYIDGGYGNNKIYGGAENDTIFGGSGYDLLDGGSGRDILSGGTGRDTLTGGSEADVFDFNTVSEMGLYSSLISYADVITDFLHLTDDIDLSTIDASSLEFGNNSFVWNGTSAITTSSAGELRYQQFDNYGTEKDYTLIFGDTDTDTAAEFNIQLKGLVTLTGDDFLV